MPIKRMEKRVEQLMAVVAHCRIDARKFDKGNKTAGIRLRKSMIWVRDECKRIRADVQNIKAARKALGKNHDTDFPNKKISIT